MSYFGQISVFAVHGKFLIELSQLLLQPNEKKKEDSTGLKQFYHLHFQEYFTRFHDVGICVVNLVDDSHEYTRGLFLLM